MRTSSTIIFLFMAISLMPLAFAGVSGPAPIPNPPNFYLSSSATAICRGQVNYIPINITNKATVAGNPHNSNITSAAIIGPNPTMQNVQLGFTNTKGLYPAENGTLVVGNINPNTSVEARLPVFVAGNASSFISTGISINYFFDSYYSDSEVRNVTFSTEICPSPLSVSVSPEVLVSGTIQDVTVNLTNTGTVPLNSISLHFSIPGQDGAWLSPQPIQIASLAPNTSVSLNKDVYVAGNQSDQSVPLNVSIIFYNGSNINQIYQNLEILSSGLIALSPSSFTVSPSSPTPASIFSISFILTDTGTAGASAMTATAVPPKGFTPFGSNSVFVGSITADSQTPVTISITASNSVKPGTYQIPIRLNYLNNLRQNLTLWANTSVFISQATFNASGATHFRTASANSSGAGLLTIILIVVIIVLGYLYYKERKKSNPKEKKA